MRDRMGWLGVAASAVIAVGLFVAAFLLGLWTGVLDFGDASVVP
jgi:hypothetical protein